MDGIPSTERPPSRVEPYGDEGRAPERNDRGADERSAARRPGTGQLSAALVLAVTENMRRPHPSASRRLETFTLVALVLFASPCGRRLRHARARMAAGQPLGNVLLAC